MPSLLVYKVLVLITLAAGSGSTAVVAYFYQGKTTTLTSQVSNLNDQTSSQANQISSLRDQIDNLTRQISQLQSTESQLLTVIQQLQQQLSASGSLCSSGKTLTIGELLDLSSALATQGRRIRDSSTLAIDDVNTMLSTAGCNLRFSTTVDDYSLNNPLALTELQSLSSAGIKVIVGPLNSGATQYVLTYADANHIVLISPSSSSPALAIPNDYLFRTVPNDAEQGLADARMISDSGASAVIIVQRHDVYGDFLANATATRFKHLGGHVIANLQYDVSTTNFTPLLDALQAEFSSNVGTYGASRIAIDVVAFEELGQMLLQAKNYAGFPWSELAWFGTDGVAQDPVITSGSWGPIAAQVRLPSTIYASANDSKTLAFYTRFDAAYPGVGCDEYCKGAYDDVWLAALATLQAGSYDGARIQSIMPTVASNYYGVTGWTELLPSGDRAPATYQIWEILFQGFPSVPTWVPVGSWDSTSDSITSYPIPSGTSINIEGAGATFPAPLVQNWTETYHNLNPAIIINYNAVGSGAGVALIRNQTVDFAASDAPLTDAQLVGAPGLTLFPETLGGVAITYNLPGLPSNIHLNLTSTVLVEIYNGTMTNWSNSAIQSINPGVTLPNLAITAVRRADASGTTYAFKDYLAHVDSWWNAHMAVDTSSVWPSFGPTGSGNSGVAGQVANTPGAIGYVEVIYAVKNGLGEAAIKNLNGSYVTPTLQSIFYAATNETVLTSPTDLRQHIVNAHGAQSYPISSYTYILAYREMSTNLHTSKDNAYALANFLWWIIGPDGQSKAPALVYAPLPSFIVVADQNLLRSFTWGGQQILTG